MPAVTGITHKRNSTDGAKSLVATDFSEKNVGASKEKSAVNNANVHFEKSGHHAP